MTVVLRSRPRPLSIDFRNGVELSRCFLLEVLSLFVELSLVRALVSFLAATFTAASFFVKALAQYGVNPLPWPGNGDRPETPLSRLTPNVGEIYPLFLPGTPPQHAWATLVG